MHGRNLLEILRVMALDYHVNPAEKRRIHRIAPGDGLIRGVGDVMLTRSDADKPTVRRTVIELLEAVDVARTELAARGVLAQSS
jgi:hypothetical protein